MRLWSSLWLVSASLLAATTARAQTIGDVNADGRVDGIDALAAMRLVQGLDTADAAARTRADVFPFPGTGGRLFGDGALTRQDAVQLLRYEVGLLSRGEVTGRFQPPRIDSFTPSHGVAGTRVTLGGAGFVPGRPGDNLVRFGEIAAPVERVTATELVVVVPEDAESAPIKLTGPGGTTQTEFPFSIVVTRAGSLVPPAALDPTRYQVVNDFLEESQPASDGAFEQPLASNGLTTQMAVPEGEDDRILLRTDIARPGEAGKLAATPATVDARSTAESLVFLCPFFYTSDPAVAAATMDVIRSDEAVDALAGVLDQVYADTDQPFADPRYEEAYMAAVSSVLERLPEDRVEDLAQDMEPQGRVAAKAATVLEVGGAESVQQWITDSLAIVLPDIHITRPPDQLTGPGLLEPESVMGNPVDWFVHLAEIDNPREAFPRGMADIHALSSDYGSHAVFPRSGHESIAFIGARSYMQYVDVFGVAWGVVTDAVRNAVTSEYNFPGLKGAATPSNDLDFPAHRDGVYVVRSFSGVLWDWEDEHATLARMPDGNRDFWIAFTFNAVMAGVDFTSIFLGDKVQTKIGPVKARAVVRKLLGVSLRKGLRLAAKKLPGGVRDLAGRDSGDMQKLAYNFIYNATVDMTGIIAADLPEILGESQSGAWAAGKVKSLKGISRFFDVMYKASRAGATGERVMTMALGWRPGYEVSPLETWILVVGEPFNPRIAGISHRAGGPGTRLVIDGEHFAADPADNEVYFGLSRARILAASTRRLEVEVPDLAPGQRCKVHVITPQGRQSSQVEFLAYHRYIDRVVPTVGYPFSADAFEGAGYAGTAVQVYGQHFDVNATPPERVAFNGTYLVVEGSQRTITGGYETRVPPGPYETAASRVEGEGYSGRQVQVSLLGKVGVQDFASNEVPFLLLDEPVVDSLSMDVAEGGDRVVVHGRNFPPAPEELRLFLAYETTGTGGSAQTVEPTYERQAYGRILFHVPPSIPDSTQVLVWVYTPAGRSQEPATFLHVTERQLGPPPKWTALPAGYRLEVNTERTGVTADEYLTMDEAWQIARGELDPSELPEKAQITGERGGSGYADQIVTAAGLTVRLGGGSLENGESLEVRGTLELGGRLRLRNGSTVRADTIRGGGLAIGGSENIVGAYGSGPLVIDGAGIEIQGTARTPATGNTVSAIHIVDCGGVGVDMADARSNGLSNVRVSGAGGTAVRLEASHGNRIEVEVSGGSATGVHVIGGADNVIGASVDSVTRHGVVVEQARATEVTAFITGCRGDGLQLVGGWGNTALCSAVDNTGDGVSLSGKARGHTVSVSQSRGNLRGVVLSGTGVEQNTVTGAVSKAHGAGVVLEAGARDNEVAVQVDSCGQAGVVVTGAGTEHNTVRGHVVGCRDHGVHVRLGARQNTVRCDSITGNTGHGVLVGGSSGRGNRVSERDDTGGMSNEMLVARNSGAGVLVKEAMDTEVEVGRVLDNGEAGVWISGVDQGQESPMGVRVGRISGSPVGLLLENAVGVDVSRSLSLRLLSGRRTEPLRIEDCGTGIWLKGASESNRLDGEFDYGRTVRAIRVESPAEVGVRLGEGASHNYLGGIHVLSSGGDGFAVAGEAQSNRFLGLRADGCLGDGFAVSGGAADNYFVNAMATENGGNGITLTDGVDNLFAGPDMDLYRNEGAGAVIAGGQGNALHGCTVMENGGDGIRVEADAADVTIGNLRSDPRQSETQVRNNGGTQIRLTDGATAVTIAGTRIERQGAAPEGTGIAVEGARGVRIGMPATRGQEWDVGSNIVGGFAEGIRISGSSTADVRVLHSYVGWSPNSRGLTVGDGARQVLIGGDGATEGNRISVGLDAGVHLWGAGTEAKVRGNRLEDNGDGLVLDSGIRGCEITGNRVERSTGDGLRLVGGATEHALSDNYIARSEGSGVVIDGASHGNHVTGNEITGNATGVVVSGGSRQNRLRGNSIYGNAGKGIHLAGGNRDLPAPTIDSFSAEGGYIQGHVDGAVPSGSVVDVFADDGDEGRQLVGSMELTGERFFLRRTVPAGLELHALVTDPDGNTSEFGPYEPSVGRARRPGTVVFTTTLGGDADVYILRPGADAPEALVADSSADHSPQLAPDGEHVVFVSDRSGNLDLWLVPAAGGEPRQLTTDGAAEYDPAWSPDGQQLAYVSERDGQAEVYVMAAQGGGGETLAYDGEVADNYAELSPDVSVGVHFTAGAGRLQALQFYLERNPAPFTWQVRAWGDGEPGEVLASGETEPASTGWHQVEVDAAVPAEFFVAAVALGANRPGLGLEYASTAGRSYILLDQWYENTDHYFIRASVGSEAVRLTRQVGVDREPCWAPDGSRLAFVSDRRGGFDLFTVSADGGGSTLLLDGEGEVRHPTWSADERIAFAHLLADGSEIGQVSARGDELEPLISERGKARDPSWHGEQLLFAAERDAGWEVYRRLSGGRVLRMTVSLGDDTEPHAGP